MDTVRRNARRSASSNGVPRTVTLPELGVSNPLTVRISVDLPAPEVPTTPKILPAGTSKVTESRAVKSPKTRLT